MKFNFYNNNLFLIYNSIKSIEKRKNKIENDSVFFYKDTDYL